MSITYAIANIDAQVGSKVAAITVVDPSDFSPAATDVTLNKGTLTQTSTYKFKGDAWGGTDLEVRHTVQPSKPGSLNVRHSLRMSTKVRRTDSVLLTEELIPYEVGIYWNTTSQDLIDVGSMSRLLQGVVSLALGAFDGTSGAPSNVPITASALGITQSLS
jgi:hypothetical protein